MVEKELLLHRRFEIITKYWPRWYSIFFRIINKKVFGHFVRYVSKNLAEKTWLHQIVTWIPYLG
jgi:hypothetical protein